MDEGPSMSPRTSASPPASSPPAPPLAPVWTEPLEAFLRGLEHERRLSPHTRDAYRRDLEDAAGCFAGAGQAGWTALTAAEVQASRPGATATASPAAPSSGGCRRSAPSSTS